MDYRLENHLKKLEYLSSQLRLTGLTVLGLSIGNLLILALLFAIFFFNLRIFKVPSSSYAQDLQKDLGLIFFISCAVFVGSLGALYRFDMIRKRLHIIADEVFDEVGWYRRNDGGGPNAPQTKIGIDERIALKSASESASLPFLSESQGVSVYVVTNFILFLAVAAFGLYLIQALNVSSTT
jgi:hypothetical protein